MLEVYILQQCNVVNLRVFTNCCVWNYTSVEKKRSANNVGLEFSDFRMLDLFFFTFSVPPTWRRVMQ